MAAQELSPKVTVTIFALLAVALAAIAYFAFFKSPTPKTPANGQRQIPAPAAPPPPM